MKDNHILSVFLTAVVALVVGTTFRIFGQDLSGDVLTILSFSLMGIALVALCWKYRHFALKSLGSKQRS